MRTLLVGALALALACLVPGSALATDSGAVQPEGPGTYNPAAGSGSLTTLFASNNNFAGNSFDITAAADLTVTGWDCNLSPVVPSFTIEVYVRYAGTANGFEQIPGEWTLLGTDVVVPVGTDLPTHVNVGGLALSAGQTVGVIIHAVEAVTGTGGFNYTNGGPGTVFSNADMSVTTFDGMSPEWPPLSVFSGRQWNGTVYYDFGATANETTTWGSLKVGYE